MKKIASNYVLCKVVNLSMLNKQERENMHFAKIMKYFQQQQRGVASYVWMQKSMQTHLFNIRDQRIIELQFLKHLSFLRLFRNSSLRTTVSNNCALQCLKHILYSNLKLLSAHSADHNALIIIYTPCSFDVFDFCLQRLMQF